MNVPFVTRGPVRRTTINFICNMSCHKKVSYLSVFGLGDSSERNLHRNLLNGRGLAQACSLNQSDMRAPR